MSETTTELHTADTALYYFVSRESQVMVSVKFFMLVHIRPLSWFKLVTSCASSVPFSIRSTVAKFMCSTLHQRWVPMKFNALLQGIKVPSKLETDGDGQNFSPHFTKH